MLSTDIYRCLKNRPGDRSLLASGSESDRHPTGDGPSSSAISRPGFDSPTRLINACYEDESVLDAFRDDVHGPQIDLRNDFFPLLEDEVILVVSTRSKPLEDSLTIVLPVKDATTTWRIVNQAHRINMDSTSETYGNVEMRVVATKEGKRKAWCTIENHLIIGDLKKVQATIDRFNGE